MAIRPLPWQTDLCHGKQTLAMANRGLFAMEAKKVVLKQKLYPDLWPAVDNVFFRGKHAVFERNIPFFEGNLLFFLIIRVRLW